MLGDGGDVAVVTDAGTPGISDPGEVLVRRRARRRLRGVDGAGAGRPRRRPRQQRAADGPLRVRGLPAAQRCRAPHDDWPRSPREQRTVVLYEAPHRVVRTIARPRRGVRAGSAGRRRPGADQAVRDGRARHARHVELGEPRGEYVIVLGGAPAATVEVDDDVDRRARSMPSWPRGASTRDAAARAAGDARRAPPARLRHRRRRERPMTGRSVDRRHWRDPSRRGLDGIGRASAGVLGYNTGVSEYVSMASSGPSAAFFDLDRTLISGSSAFVFAAAARRAGSARDAPARPRRGVGAAVQGARRQRRQVGRRPRPHPRRGHRDAPGRPRRPQRRGAAAPARQDPPRGATPARPPSPRRAGDLHRVGVTGGDRRAAGDDARDDRRHRHAQRGRRRRLHRRARRAVLLRPGQGRGDASRSPAGRGSTSPSATPTATRPATCRCSRRSAIPSPSTRTATLERHARQRGWPIVHFSQRTRAVIRRAAAGVAATALTAAGFAGGVRYARIAAR